MISRRDCDPEDAIGFTRMDCGHYDDCLDDEGTCRACARDYALSAADEYWERVDYERARIKHGS